MSAANYYLKQLSPLVGGRITNLVQSEAEEDGDEDFFGLEITLPNGQKRILFFLSDDEGNGPGSFEIQEA